MSKFRNSGTSGNRSIGTRNPFHSSTNAQYTRYLQCLQREDIPNTSGPLTDAQLKCAVQTIGCLPGYESRCSKLSTITEFDTPIINPASGVTPKDDPSTTTVTVNGKQLSVSGKKSTAYNNGKYTTAFGNSTSSGQPEMSGYAFMPSTFRDTSQPIISPEKYGLTGINRGILPGRAVSATHQRISGDKIVPLAKQLSPISQAQLQNVSNTTEGWAKTYSELNNIPGSQSSFRAPPRISNGVNIGGVSINNMGSNNPWNSVDFDDVTFVTDGTPGTAGTNGTDGTNGTNGTDPTTIYPGPGSNPNTSTATPGSGNNNGNNGGTVVNPDGTIQSPGVLVYDDDFAPFDNQNIRYNTQPQIDLTPLEMDSNGNYVPAGPTARAPISSPTPEATFTQEDLLGIPENTELYLNGHKVIIRSPDVCDIKSQINCGVMGVKAETSRACTSDEAGAGGAGIENSITLSSCDGSAFTVANGCGGGTYKQVGDFHINRGFDQQKTKSYNANALIVNRQLSSYIDENGDIQNNEFMRIDDAGNVVDLNSDLPYTAPKYTFTIPTPDLRPDLIETLQPDENGEIIIPQSGRRTALMDNTTETTLYSTGGSGYRIGDRLRIVGGTPVNNTLAPLTKICIEGAGAGFTNPANIQILINNDGQASGIGASAAVTELDQNGGIAAIEMLNYGAGYDVSKPPTITVYDKSPTTAEYTTVSSAWTADFNTNAPYTINSGEIVLIQDTKEYADATGERKTTEITKRFYLATAGLTLGNVNEVGKTQASGASDLSRAYVDPESTDLYTPNRVRITRSAGLDISTGVRHNSYAKITHFPATKIYGSGITVANDSTSDFRLTYVEDLWNAMQTATEQKLGDLTGDDVQVAIYTEVSGDLVLQAFAGYGNHTENGSQILLGNFYNVSGSSYTPTNGDTVYVGIAQTGKYFIPQPINSQDTIIGDDYFTIEGDSFTDADTVSVLFPDNADIIVEVTENWWDQLLDTNERAKLVSTTDPSIPKVQPILSAKIGINPNDDIDNNNAFLNGYESLSGPLRVAKFIVTGVNNEGTITQLRVIDRGLYKIFPSDLTYGIPLEYDYVSDGFLNVPLGESENITTDSQRRRILGVVDPSRNNAEYGTVEHTEYIRSVFPSVSDLVLRMASEGVTTINGRAITDAVKEEISRVLDKRAQGESLTPEEQVTFNSFQALVNDYYASTGTSAYKHPDWERYAEFYYNGDEYVRYTGSPGGYDPSTYVIVDTTYGTDPNRAARYGTLLKKDKLIDLSLSPVHPEYGKYLGSLTTGETQIAGGTGARVFLTSQEVPNCLEKGRAQESLGLPDEVNELNAPNSLARALNNALSGAGYSPDDISFRVRDFDEIGVIDLDSDYPALRIDSPTPGLLDKLGIPRGDYNMGMLCIEATLNDPTLTDDQANVAIDQLYNSDAFGVINGNTASSLTGIARDVKNPTTILSLLCVDRLGLDGLPGTGGTPGIDAIPGTDGTTGIPGTNGAQTVGTPGSGLSTDPGSQSRNPGYSSGYPGYPGGFGAGYNGPFPLNDNNSIFADGSSSALTEMFKYDITNIYGDTVAMSSDAKQQTEVCVFESKRFNDINTIDTTSPISAELASETNAWIDNFNGTGWAYLENGIVQRAQTEMLDTKFISDALLYNPETGNKSAQLSFWDPFKGILPGFVRNEIHHISEVDPVSYTNSRTVFGRNSIGKVWWDTSTVRYQWYEQGSNEERRNNWGRTFPGSSITICEWIESKSLPTNWNGNGAPRWRDSYVTERHYNSVTGEYELYYYYWVQNRSILDDRVKRSLHRQLDTQTIAKYVANPVGYGLQMISFISPDSMMVSNAREAMDAEESHLQVNFSRNLNPDGLKHTAWKLMREGDDTSDVPEHLTNKLIDSLCGYNAIGEAVPDNKLSEVEMYGIKFRPRQTMFKDVKSARRVMFTVLNEMLASIKLNTQYPEWDANLPSFAAYHRRTSWYAPIRVDATTNQIIRYDSSYKPVYTTNSVKELYKYTDLPDGTVIQVNASQNGNNSLWVYDAPSGDYEQIAIENETIQFLDAVYTDDTTPLLGTELRALLVALNENVFINNALWNVFFFEMLKHTYVEQQQLDWAFKTSYLYVEKEENDLIEFTGFKPDNFQKVLDYMNEVKPYNAKIREYKDGKRTPIDYFTQNSLSDFDKPAYVDPVTATVRMLDESNPDDLAIMQSDPQYTKYLSQSDKTADPFRKTKTTLTFDRTNWQLTTFDWDMSTQSANQSIAENIANLNILTDLEVSSNSAVRAADRIFKFDTEVQDLFATEVNTYLDDTTASSNIEITGNAVQMQEIIDAGQLSLTLAAVKTKVGGNFQGEELNAYEFSTLPDERNYTVNPLTEYGFGIDAWDQNTDNDLVETTVNGATSIGKGDVSWDETKQLIEYEGSFTESSTLLRDDVLYEGFDGVTFQRVLYGAERPEELALIDPLESLIITVTTTPYADGDQANANVELGTEIFNGANVVYRNHRNLFGGVDYIRIRDDSTTVTTSNVYTYSTEITVESDEFLVVPNPEQPGYLWIGDELVAYGRRINGTITSLVRGAKGTTIQDHPVGTPIYDAGDIVKFNDLEPESNVWLDTGVSYSNEGIWDQNSWDRIVAGNTTVITTGGVVANVISNVSANITVTSNANIILNNGIKITNDATSNVDFVLVTGIDNNTITVRDGSNASLDLTNVFITSANVTVEIVEYGDQDMDDYWDASSQTFRTRAQSLSDRAYLDFDTAETIMRHLHNL